MVIRIKFSKGLMKAPNMSIFLAFLLILWYIGPTMTTMATTITTVSQIYYSDKIKSGLDDAYERSGYIENSKVVVAMGKKWGSVYRGGFRFNNVNIPRGATVKSAAISFAYNWVSGSRANIDLYAEATANPVSFSSARNDISNRPTTIAKIDWNNLPKKPWGNYITSPDISSLIQEIVNRPDWQTGNSVVILAYEGPESTDEWEAISYEGTGWLLGLFATKLEIVAEMESPITPPTIQPGIGIIIIRMDDVQEDYKEDWSIRVTELHIKKGVPINLAVIPSGMTTPQSSMRPYIIDWATNHGDLIKITSHGYDHTEYFGRYSYDKAKNRLGIALQPFKDWGLPNVKSFCPPYASMNTNTFRAMKDLGLTSYLSTPKETWSKSDTQGIVVVQDAVIPFASNTQIISNIDNRINQYGYAHLSFHMFDFDENRFNQYSNLLDILKTSGKYQFMTAEQYFDYLNR